MKLINFLMDHNKSICAVSFGLPFKPNCCLWDLPRTRNEKNVIVLGLTPYTVEEVVSIPYELRDRAYSITSSYYQAEDMIDQLKALSI